MATQDSNMTEKQSNDQVYYTCRKCATRLFDRDAVLHEETTGHQEDGVGVSNTKASWGRRTESYQSGVRGKCTSVFVADAPLWASELTTNEGRLTCPKCSARVGSFSWSGAPCSCGKWVTPAFQFQLSRIDPKGLVRCDHIVAIIHGNVSNKLEASEDKPGLALCTAVDEDKSVKPASAGNGR